MVRATIPYNAPIDGVKKLLESFLPDDTVEIVQPDGHVSIVPVKYAYASITGHNIPIAVPTRTSTPEERENISPRGYSEVKVYVPETVSPNKTTAITESGNNVYMWLGLAALLFFATKK